MLTARKNKLWEQIQILSRTIGHLIRKKVLYLILLVLCSISAFQFYLTARSYIGNQQFVILIAVDTLRVDHVSGFGYKRITTPHLDALLNEEAIGFNSAYSPSSWTLPSTISLLTSLPPNLHEVEDREQTLHPDVPTLASAFSKEGWLTAAFVTHIYVSSLFGINSGFDEFNELSIDWSFKEGKQLRAEELNRHVLPWISKNYHNKFFLYLHYFDPHWNYDPPPPFNTKFVDSKYRGHANGSWRFIRRFIPRKKRMSKADLDHVIALYDGEIAYTDFHLNQLFDHLKSLNIWDKTLLIILSDHGEEFQDHNSMHHIKTLYEEVLRVPLIVKLPGGRPMQWKKRVNARVSTMDVAPTILDLVGIHSPKTFQGKPLIPLMKNESQDRTIFARTMRHKSDSMTLIKDHYKLILPFGRKKAKPELYDLAADPKEKSSLLKKNPKIAKKLKTEIEKNTSIRSSEMGLPGVGTEVKLTNQQKKLLEALGYIE